MVKRVDPVRHHADIDQLRTMARETIGLLKSQLLNRAADAMEREILPGWEGMRILRKLHEAPQPLQAKDLVAYAGASVTAVNNVLVKLEHNGWAHRNDGGARWHLWCETPHGADLCRRLARENA